KSVDTDLEYHDVQIGGGALLNVPKAGSRALIGIVENKAAATFLLMATKLEEVHWTAELMKLNGDKHGGLIIFQKLFDELDKEKARVDKLYDAINNSTPSTGAPDSGALLQTGMKTILATAGLPGEYTSNLINQKVQHGD